jgi:hypothetical protein
VVRTLARSKKEVAGSIIQRVFPLDLRKYCEESYFDEEDQRLSAFGVCILPKCVGLLDVIEGGMRGVEEFDWRKAFSPRDEMQLIADEAREICLFEPQGKIRSKNMSERFSIAEGDRRTL